jgi:hypothetical protein
MPITKYTGANIKKMKKDDLIHHIIDLYQFIDLFDNSDLIKKLQAEIETLKSNLKVARERCSTWSIDEYNRGYKEATIQSAKDHEEFNEIWKTEGITEQDIIDMKEEISYRCDVIKTIEKLDNQKEEKVVQLHEDNLKQRQEIKKLKTLITTIKSTIDDGIPK